MHGEGGIKPMSSPGHFCSVPLHEEIKNLSGVALAGTPCNTTVDKESRLLCAQVVEMHDT